MISLRDAPIKLKLMLVVIVTSSLALMLLGGAVIAYELITFRKTITTNTDVLAQVVGSVATSSLAFDNQEDAMEVLSALAAAPQVTSAAIYTEKGNLYARYPADAPVDAFPSVPEADGAAVQSAHLVMFRPILQEGSRLGTIYLRSEFTQMHNRLIAYGSLVLLMGVLAVAGALAVSALLQRLISRPILELAKTARAVSERQDYSVRATRLGRDEIGELTDAFNQMLTRIGEATAALAESEERRRRALEGSETGTWEFDLNTRQATWDGHMFLLMGVRKASWRGTLADMLQVIHPEDRNTVERKMAETVATRQDLKVEFRITNEDGQIRHIATRGGLFYDSDGNPIRMSGVSMDITAAKETEAALQKAMQAAEAANRAKDEFLAILSHELRTPLSPVLATLAMLDEDTAMPPALRSELDMIRRNVEVEARLIDDLLDVTRIARGKLELHRQDLDLRTLLDHAVRNYLKDPAAQKQLETVVEIDPAAVTHIHADGSRITQVLWNLLQNAWKFTPAGGSIRIRVFNEPAAHPERPGQLDLVVAITDSGIGIEPDLLPRIFDAFEQGERARTRLFGGLGLGLAISRAIVELHGGQLTASSAGSNRGATFTVRLPAMMAPHSENNAPLPKSPAGAAPQPALRTARILLVEDHADTAQQLARLLRRAGHEVTCATSLAQARDAAAAGSFSLLLSDLGLPDGSGHELMRELAAKYGFPGIALSGYGMEEDVKQSLAAGFSRHLTKPVNWAELKATIQVLAAMDGAGG